MTKRICKLEQFFPLVGTPVLQVHEEETLSDGTVIRLDPRNPTPDEFQSGLEQVIAVQANRITQLESDIQNSQAELAIARTKIESLTEDVSELASLRSDNAKLAAENQQLRNDVPFDPDSLSIAALRARLYPMLSTSDLIKLVAADAPPELKQVAATVESWKPEWPVLLKSPEFQGMMQVLIASELLTEDEVAKLTQPATRTEAFVAP